MLKPNEFGKGTLPGLFATLKDHPLVRHERRPRVDRSGGWGALLEDPDVGGTVAVGSTPFTSTHVVYASGPGEVALS